MESYDPSRATGYRVQLQTIHDGRVISGSQADSVRYILSGWVFTPATVTEFNELP